jgi:MFS transporter, MHS family, proline/betaine transporter
MILKSKYIYLCGLGNSLEFFEFTLFGFVAPLIQKIFWVSGFEVSLSSTYLVFSIGLVARPLGGIMFGYMGDKFGRRVAILSSIFLMSLSTLALGCLPIETFPKQSFIALIVIRLLQGISAGGEFSGAIIYAAEKTPSKNRAFVTSFVGAGGMVGMILGLFVSQMIINSDQANFLWRVGFWGASSFGIALYFLRRAAIHKSLRPLKTEKLEFSFLKKLLAPFWISAYGGILIYFGMFIVRHQFEKIFETAFLLPSILLFLPPVFAYLSDLTNRKFTAIIGIVLSFCALVMISNGINSFYVLNLYFIGAAAYIGPMHAMMFSLFKEKERYRGVSLSYALGMGVLGGLSPYLGALMLESMGAVFWITGGLSLFAFALIFIVLNTDSRGEYGTESIQSAF